MVEWETTTIGELLEFKNGLNKGKEYFGQGTPIVNYMDVYKNRGIHAGQLCGRVTLSANEIKRFDVYKGDVLFTRTSETPEEVGYASVMLENIEDCVFSGFVLRGRPITNKLDINYCQYAFMTEDIRKAIMSGCTYTTRALTNGKQLSAIEIKLPPLPEQRHIATALSDTDALIAVLEKLIAKKRNIKQGAMQELLTGKRRLLGFSGEWVGKKLGEIGTITSSGVDKKINENEMSVTLLNYLDVYRYTYIKRNMLNHVVTAEDRKVSQCSILKGDVFFTPTSETADDIAKTAVATENMSDVVYSYHVVRLRPFTDYNGIFIKYACDTAKFVEQTTRLADGSGTRYVISLPKFREQLEICIPPTLAEQTAIAAILTDMDAEIDALTAKLAKLKHIKQAMMSELLTGKIRLTEQEMEVALVAERTALPKQESLTENPHHGYSEGYEDAVILVALVNLFGTEQYPFTAFDCQKFPYLFHRHLEGVVKGYKKFPGGPYNPSLKFRTARPIALSKNYIRECIGKYKGFVISENAQKALSYFAEWYGDEPLKWLEQFRYLPKRKDELELLTTTDKAMVELRNIGKPITLQAVKDLIKKSPAWKDKLKRPIFSDENIIRAINWSNNLFGQEETDNGKN